MDTRSQGNSGSIAGCVGARAAAMVFASHRVSFWSSEAASVPDSEAFLEDTRWTWVVPIRVVSIGLVIDGAIEFSWKTIHITTTAARTKASADLNREFPAMVLFGMVDSIRVWRWVPYGDWWCVLLRCWLLLVTHEPRIAFWKRLFYYTI
jgi:hypothetical protein